MMLFEITVVLATDNKPLTFLPFKLKYRLLAHRALGLI